MIIFITGIKFVCCIAFPLSILIQLQLASHTEFEKFRVKMQEVMCISNFLMCSSKVVLSKNGLYVIPKMTIVDYLW